MLYLYITFSSLTSLFNIISKSDLNIATSFTGESLKYMIFLSLKQKRENAQYRFKAKNEGRTKSVF